METSDRMFPMKIIGRKVLTECDVSSMAKKRLALWIKQLADTRWLTIDAIKANFPDVRELENNRIEFPFTQIGIQVEALMSLDLEIICIEKVIEQEAGKG